MDQPKEIATSFLQEVIAGHIDQAYAKYVDMTGRHHNVFTPAGLEALRQGMKDADAQFPNKAYEVKRVMQDEPFVAIFGHLILKPKEMDLSTVHLFRIENGKITEFWDVAQNLPKKPVNSDGAF